MCEAPPSKLGHEKNDLLGWKEFPKGLRVLLHESSSSSSDIKSKLEQMEYSGTEKLFFFPFA